MIRGLEITNPSNNDATKTPTEKILSSGIEIMAIATAFSATPLPHNLNPTVKGVMPVGFYTRSGNKILFS